MATSHAKQKEVSVGKHSSFIIETVPPPDSGNEISEMGAQLSTLIESLSAEVTSFQREASIANAQALSALLWSVYDGSCAPTILIVGGPPYFVSTAADRQLVHRALKEVSEADETTGRGPVLLIYRTYTI